MQLTETIREKEWRPIQSNSLLNYFSPYQYLGIKKSCCFLSSAALLLCNLYHIWVNYFSENIVWKIIYFAQEQLGIDVLLNMLG